MSKVYIVFARFDKLSGDHRARFVRPVAERMKAIEEKLELDISKRLDDMKRQNNNIVNTLTTVVKYLKFTGLCDKNR